MSVQERTPGGNLHLRWWNSGEKRWVWESLGHRDKEVAQQHAADLAHALQTARDQVSTAALSPPRLFALYETEVTVNKKGQQPEEDRRRMDIWQAFLAVQGIDDVSDLDDVLLDEFIRQRRAGELAVPDRQLRKKVTDTTIGADIVFLNSVLNWAHRKKVKGPKGKRRRLLADNPIEDYGVLRTKNPRRLWATYDWFLAVRGYCETPQPIDARGIFGEFLDLLEALGWRVTAVCELRASDLTLMRTSTSPNGRLHKREDVDKEGVDQWIPLSEEARAAIDRLLEKRPAVGDAYLFPAPKADRPWTRHYVAHVLQRLVNRVNTARLKDDLEPIPFVNAHAFRRKWEEERRHLPLKDRMDASGRKDEKALNASYLRRDEHRVLQVMQEPRKLRGGMVLRG